MFKCLGARGQRPEEQADEVEDSDDDVPDNFVDPPPVAGFLLGRRPVAVDVDHRCFCFCFVSPLCECAGRFLALLFTALWHFLPRGRREVVPSSKRTYYYSLFGGIP